MNGPSENIPTYVDLYGLQSSANVHILEGLTASNNAIRATTETARKPCLRLGLVVYQPICFEETILVILNADSCINDLPRTSKMTVMNRLVKLCNSVAFWLRTQLTEHNLKVESH